jgi:hypothetical protein
VVLDRAGLELQLALQDRRSHTQVVAAAVTWRLPTLVLDLVVLVVVEAVQQIPQQML